MPLCLAIFPPLGACGGELYRESMGCSRAFCNILPVAAPPAFKSFRVPGTSRVVVSLMTRPKATFCPVALLVDRDVLGG